MSPPRLWVVTPELHRGGGTERCVAEEVERWRGRFDLRVISMDVRDVDTEGIEIRRVPRLPGPHLLRYTWWYVANQVVRRIDAWRVGHPDVVFSPGVNCRDADVMGVHVLFDAYWERVLRPGLGPPVDRQLRTWHRFLYAGLVRALERWTYGGPALLWSVSPADAQEIERIYGRPAGTVTSVPSGVDLVAFSSARRRRARQSARRELGVEDRRVALVVGNALRSKGADVALGALRHLPEDVIVAVAGRNDPGELARLAEEAGAVGRYAFWPHRPDPMPYYAAADLLLAPSRMDAFPLPLLEAMACGLPVVMSARSVGVAELVRDGREALVLEDPEDQVAVASATARVLEEPDLARSLSRAGRRLATRFSWETNAERTSALILRELGTPRALVLATDPRATGGIQRATRVLLAALAELLGSDRVGTLAVWSRGDADVPGRLLRAGRRGAGGTARVGLLDRARFVASSLRAARRWRRRLTLFAAHPSLAPVAWGCRLVSGAPYAVWCHGTESWGRLSPAVALALRAADVVFAPSRFTARRVERVAGLVPGSVRVVPHCVPPEAGVAVVARERPIEPPVVLTVARLTPENRYKGVDTLLYAWPRVRERVEATLQVVGGGPDLPRLRRVAELLDLDGSVRFSGRLSDPELAASYATSRVFAMPARHRLSPRPQGEGFGLVYVEAGAAGLPVVAGRGGGAEDAVEQDGSGFLVDAADPSSVADAIVRLLSDRTLARRMGARGRALARERFSYEAFREHVAEIVGDLGPRGLR